MCATGPRALAGVRLACRTDRHVGRVGGRCAGAL